MNDIRVSNATAPAAGGDPTVAHPTVGMRVLYTLLPASERGIDSGHIAQRLGIAESHVRAALARLRDYGYADCIGYHPWGQGGRRKKMYVITERGRSKLRKQQSLGGWPE